MSSTREDDIILEFQNNIEYTLFNKDGVVNDEILEQMENCQLEPKEVFGTKIIFLCIYCMSVSETAEVIYGCMFHVVFTRTSNKNQLLLQFIITIVILVFQF